MNATQTSTCSFFPHDQWKCDTIMVVHRVTGAVSLIGCCFVVFTMWLFRRYNTFPQRIIFWISVCGGGGAIANIMGESTDMRYCRLIAFTNTFFDWGMLFWVVAVAIRMYLAIFHKSPLASRYEWAYHCLVWVPALTISVLPFFWSKYGNAGAWCWIVHDFGWRIGMWYGPMFFLVAILFILYISIMVKIRSVLLKLWRGEMPTSPAQKVTMKFLKTEVRPLVFYPLVYMILYVIPLANRIHNYASPGESEFALIILSAICAPSLGAGNSLVYGLARETRRKLKISEIKKAWSDHFNSTRHESNYGESQSGNSQTAPKKPYNSYSDYSMNNISVYSDSDVGRRRACVGFTQARPNIAERFPHTSLPAESSGPRVLTSPTENTNCSCFADTRPPRLQMEHFGVANTTSLSNNRRPGFQTEHIEVDNNNACTNTCGSLVLQRNGRVARSTFHANACSSVAQLTNHGVEKDTLLPHSTRPHVLARHSEFVHTTSDGNVRRPCVHTERHEVAENSSKANTLSPLAQLANPGVRHITSHANTRRPCVHIEPHEVAENGSNPNTCSSLVQQANPGVTHITSHNNARRPCVEVERNEVAENSSNANTCSSLVQHANPGVTRITSHANVRRPCVQIERREVAENSSNPNTCSSLVQQANPGVTHITSHTNARRPCVEVERREVAENSSNANTCGSLAQHANPEVTHITSHANVRRPVQITKKPNNTHVRLGVCSQCAVECIPAPRHQCLIGNSDGPSALIDPVSGQNDIQDSVNLRQLTQTTQSGRVKCDIYIIGDPLESKVTMV